MKDIEVKLKQIFDFQYISKNKSLEDIIKSTESRYGIESDEYELYDDDLEIFAAGDIYLRNTQSMEGKEDE